MNIFAKIRESKEKVMAYKDKKEQEKVIRTAKKLKELKERRIKAEGREKIYSLRDKEQKRLSKANENLKKRTPAYRIANALIDNYKKNKEKREMGRLPGSNIPSGSGTIGNFTLGSNIPSGSGTIGNFTLGSNPTKPKQKARKGITINIR